MRYASGDYVQFLDADDELDCLKLKKSVEFLNNNPDFFGYCTAIKYFDELCSKNIEGYSNFKNMNNPNSHLLLCPVRGSSSFSEIDLCFCHSVHVCLVN